MFAPAFQRVEQVAGSETYLRGLLGAAARKNVEQMALELDENVAICNTSWVKARGRQNQGSKSINGWWRRRWEKGMVW